MSLTTRPLLPAILLFLELVALAKPVRAQPTPPLPHHHATPAPSLQTRMSRYSPRVRRSTIAYLRLRLLELREEDLAAVRAAIERKLKIDDLLFASPSEHTHEVGDQR